MANSNTNPRNRRQDSRFDPLYPAPGYTVYPNPAQVANPPHLAANPLVEREERMREATLTRLQEALAPLWRLVLRPDGYIEACWADQDESSRALPYKPQEQIARVTSAAQSVRNIGLSPNINPKDTRANCFTIWPVPLPPVSPVDEPTFAEHGMSPLEFAWYYSRTGGQIDGTSPCYHFGCGELRTGADNTEDIYLSAVWATAYRLNSGAWFWQLCRPLPPHPRFVTLQTAWQRLPITRGEEPSKDHALRQAEALALYMIDLQTFPSAPPPPPAPAPLSPLSPRSPRSPLTRK